MFLVKNISKSYLPLKGTGFALAPGVEADLCEVTKQTVVEVSERSDVSRWLSKKQLQILESSVPLKKTTKDYPEVDARPLEVEPESNPLKEKLEKLSFAEIKEIAKQFGVHVSRSKLATIESLLAEVDNDELIVSALALDERLEEDNESLDSDGQDGE